MTLTTIPIQKETRDLLRQIARKSESWDKVLRRLYENEITIKNTEIFFSADSLSYEEAVKEIEQW
jgi:predicted CopG family antitoxin